jgi:hypothetical protein
MRCGRKVKEKVAASRTVCYEMGEQGGEVADLELRRVEVIATLNGEKSSR